MKKITTAILTTVLALGTAFSATACGSLNDLKEGGKEKDVDASKTQLNVFYYDAGYGVSWLEALETAFEEAYKDVSFESGKKGVQVHHKGQMKEFTAETLANDTSGSVYFLENADYYALTAGKTNALENISDIVTTPNEKDNNKAISDKLTKQQKDFYTSLDGNYYALPHYVGSFGIIYDRDLFEDKGLFFAKEGTEENPLISAKHTEKTAGPDGQEGTEDDGLPATYDEFYTLCSEMVAKGITPLCFPGAYYDMHLSLMYTQLIAEYEGYDQMMLNYTFDGTANDLIKIENGEIVFDAEGNPVTESVTVTSTDDKAPNGKELSRQAGKYYAMKFLETIMNEHNNKSSEPWFTSDSYNSNFSHKNNQNAFLRSTSKNAPIAMLVDGVWWQQEANAVFEDMKKADEKYAKENRKFGWMPLPKADESKVGTERIYFDHLGAMACIKSGLSDVQKEVSKLFLQFACTDRSLIEFTNVTGAVKGYDYTKALKEDTSYQNLSYFTKSVVDCIDNGKQLFNVSASKFLNKNYIEIAIGANPGNGGGFDALVNGTGYNSPAGAFKLSEGRVNAETYFVSYYQTKSASTIWGK